MTTFQFRIDEKLTETLKKYPFTYSAEVIPPRNGTEQSRVLEQIQKLVAAGAQFLAVTKGAGGSLRGGSLPIAQTIKENFRVPCIAHFTCRDLTVQEVENQLVDHHYFGVRNILALRGDPPDGQSEFQPREGGHRYAYELIRQIRAMNEGKFLSRPGNAPAGLTESPNQEKTDFCIGAAAYPEHPDPFERIEFFRLKVESGAEYGITDLLFDDSVYAEFLEGLSRVKVHIPVLPGTRILKTQAQADRVMKKFRVRVPPEYYSRLPAEDSPDALKRALELSLELTERLKKRGAPGLHLFVITDTEAASEFLKLSRSSSLAEDPAAIQGGTSTGI